MLLTLKHLLDGAAERNESLRVYNLRMISNAYLAYGLCMQSDLAFPELSPHPHPAADPDVTIRLLAPALGPIEALRNGHYEVRPGLFQLAVPEVALYRVEDGKRISIEPCADAAPEKVRLFLLGSAMGALLYQRGLFPLHGSAVETRWGAMIFAGVPAAGKSTLAAHFRLRGYRLLCDDVCAVSATAEGLKILPAYARFRLCADAYERLGTPQGASFAGEKFVVPMAEGYCPDPVPLRAIHILSYHEGESPRIEVLRGFERVRRLLENLYRPHYLKGQRTQAHLMRLAGTIAQQATLFSLTRRRDAAQIEGLVSFLELAWAEHFAAGPSKEKN